MAWGDEALDAADAEATRKVQEEKAKKAQGPAYVAPQFKRTAVQDVKLDRSGIDQQFQGAQTRAAQAASGALQTRRDAIARRAAALGGGPGGAMIKVEQRAMEENARQLGDVNQQIEAGKTAELRRLGEVETQMNMQRQEAQAGRDLAQYQGEVEAALQKHGMDINQAQFAAQQEMAREAQKIQQGQFAQQMGLQKMAQQIQGTQFAKSMELQWQQFGHEKVVDKFNMELATKLANEKDMLEQFFGNFSMGSMKGGWNTAFGGGSGSIFNGEGGF